MSNRIEDGSTAPAPPTAPVTPDGSTAQSPITGDPDSTTRSLALGSQIAGRYRISRVLGVGGMGEVYAADDLIVGGSIALKTLRPELAGSSTAIERFRREIALARKVTNEHVCRLHDVGTHDGRLFITMELLDGGTLADRIRADGALPLADVDGLARKLVAGLAALHAAGIVHRDFKPSNVILAGDRTVITDFGLARSTGPTDAALTADGGMLGTPAYMAPEQVDGRPATTASDIYALGVVLFELVTGKLPFREDTAMATATARLKRDAPLASSLRPDLPARWNAAIARCLAREPADRLARVEDVLGEVSPPARKIRRVWIAPVAVSAVAVTGAVFALTRSDPKPVVASIEVSDCVAAADRLTGVWDADTRSTMGAKFATARGPGVEGTWKMLSGDLDRYAARWSTLWSAACVASDREADRLLYAQRLTCLDNALIAFQGVTQSIAASDAAAYSEGYIGTTLLPVLDDCESTSVLRAQPPAPPIAKREQVTRLMIDVQRARTDLRTALNARRMERYEEAMARLERHARELDKLDVPEAAIAWYWRAHMLAANGEPARIEIKRVAIAKALQRARELRNDQWLVWGQLLKLNTLRLQREKVDDALAEATDAVARAGSPTRGKMDLLSERAVIAADRRQFDRALADLEEAARLRQRMESGEKRFGLEASIALYLRMDRVADALVAAREMRDTALATWGPDHFTATSARREVQKVLIQARDFRGALAEIEAVIASYTKLKLAKDHLVDPHRMAALLAMELGDRDRIATHITGMGGSIAAHLDLLQRANGQNLVGAMRWEIAYLEAHDAELTPDQRDDVRWKAVIVEMMAGNYAAMTGLAARIRPGALDFGAAILADVFDGRTGAARAKLRTWKFLERDLPKIGALAPIIEENLRWFLLGLVEMKVRDWPAAVTAFERSVASARKLPINGDTGELIAMFGLARVEAGQHAAAIDLLEEAIDLSIVHMNGLAYYQPIAQLALARALWDSGGDKVRARTLAARARDGFAAFGKGREPDRQAAIRWLADHP